MEKGTKIRKREEKKNIQKYQRRKNFLAIGFVSYPITYPSTFILPTTHCIREKSQRNPVKPITERDTRNKQ